MSKSWIITICVVSVVSGILSCVMPRSSAKKAFQYVCSVVLVYAVLYPFISGSFEFPDLEKIFGSDKADTSYEFSSKSEEVYLIAAQSGCISAAENVLKEINIAYDEVTAHCVTDDGEIILKKISVFGSYSQEQKEQIKKALYKTFPEKTVIEFEGGTDEQ